MKNIKNNNDHKLNIVQDNTKEYYKNLLKQNKKLVKKTKKSKKGIMLNRY